MNYNFLKLYMRAHKLFNLKDSKKDTKYHSSTISDIVHTIHYFSTIKMSLKIIEIEILLILNILLIKFIF